MIGLFLTKSQIFKELLLIIAVLPFIQNMEKVSENENHEQHEPPKKIHKASSESDLNWDFPTTIEGFEYKFDNEGVLKHIETGKSYEFNFSTNNLYNQKRYEALGELITEYVYELLETEVKLKKINIPIDPEENEPQGFIFMSEDALTNPDKLLVVIHGSGVVRAGQWARRLIINDCLDNGTQLPFIKQGLTDGYGIIVLNTNLNTVNGKPIRESATSKEHTTYVWEHFIQPSKAKNIAIVAHSFGGVCTMHLVKNHHEKMQNRVFAIALTDSVHNLENQGITHLPQMKWLREVARNWVSSPKPLDESVPSYGRIDIYKVSAGTTMHERTSCNSFQSIFKFFKERYREVNAEEEKAKPQLHEL